jgi:predicted transcriptional regulator
VPATTTLRVRPDTRDRLNRLAQADKLSAPDMLDRLVEREERERLLMAMNDDFESLRGNESAWEEFKAETAAWDATSAGVDPKA